jgi:hypothetical protein
MTVAYKNYLLRVQLESSDENDPFKSDACCSESKLADQQISKLILNKTLRMPNVDASIRFARALLIAAESQDVPKSSIERAGIEELVKIALEKQTQRLDVNLVAPAPVLLPIKFTQTGQFQPQAIVTKRLLVIFAAAIFGFLLCMVVLSSRLYSKLK